MKTKDWIAEVDESRRKPRKPKKAKGRVWILCEAFALTGSHTAVHESIDACAVACGSRKSCMAALETFVKSVVDGSHDGREHAEEYVAQEVEEVLSKPARIGKRTEYRYSADDREVIWKLFPAEVR